MSTRLERRTIAKASSYLVNPALDRPGTVFTNAGATGAISFTLPIPGQGTRGWWYRFICVADHNLIVAATTLGTLITTHNLAANAISLQTPSQRIAGIIGVQCVEIAPNVFRWVAGGESVGHTYSVAP